MSDTRTATGVVEVVSEKSFGEKTLYGVKLEGDNQWYRTGEEKPKCQTGDVISMEYGFTKTGNTRVDVDSIKVTGRSEPKAKSSSYSGGGYNDPARQQAITYQSSRKDAIEVLKVLIQTESIKLGSQQNKKYGVIMGMLDELTNQFYNDVVNFDPEKVSNPQEEQNKEPEPSDDLFED